jgi:Uma2 family endonuclease
MPMTQKDIVEHLLGLASRQQLIDRAMENCEHWFTNDSGEIDGWISRDLEKQFSAHTLVFKRADWDLIYIDTRIKLLASDGREIGHYRLITTLDGETDDNYLVIEISKANWEKAIDHPTQPGPITFEEFLTQYGDDDRYELHDGQVFELEPTGSHEEIVAFIDRKLNVQIDNLLLPYFLPQRCLIKPLGGRSGLRPDLVILDREQLIHDPLWAKEAIITRGTSIKLVVEVVGRGWQNDYVRKAHEYAILGIPEYWIVDYAALGGLEFIGRPKQATLTICTLGENGYYDKQRLRGTDAVVSRTFPNLTLTAAQVLSAGQ